EVCAVPAGWSGIRNQSHMSEKSTRLVPPAVQLRIPGSRVLSLAFRRWRSGDFADHFPEPDFRGPKSDTHSQARRIPASWSFQPKLAISVSPTTRIVPRWHKDESAEAAAKSL